MPNSSSLNSSLFKSTAFSATIPDENAFKAKSVRESSPFSSTVRKSTNIFGKSTEATENTKTYCGHANLLRKVVSASKLNGTFEENSALKAHKHHHSPLGTSSSASELAPLTSDDYPSSTNSMRYFILGSAFLNFLT